MTEYKNIFYKEGEIGENCILSEEESFHCTRVLRLAKNDIVSIIDGEGGFYFGKILNADSKKSIITVTERFSEFEKRNYYCHIGIAPTKSTDRLEWFIEKATEIGIDEITPIICDRSERKKIRSERLEKVIISAMKQSVKAYKPKLNPMVRFNELIESSKLKNKYIAHCDDKARSSLFNIDNDVKQAIILIGPEGDFSPDEIELANQKNYKSVSLGGFRLRTETAGIVALHTISILNS